MNRREGILSLITTVESIADIGSDHGYVAKALVDQKKAEKVYVTDVAEGPLSRARKNLEGYPVEFYLMDGLLGFEKELSSCIVAGMGGELISRIISQRKDLFLAMEYFMVQPMQHLDALRRFLYDEGFYIEEEVLVYEDHFYEILRCKKGKEEIYDFRFPKGLIQNRSLYRDYLLEKREKLDFILEKTKGRDEKKYNAVLEEKQALLEHCRLQDIVLY